MSSTRSCRQGREASRARLSLAQAKCTACGVSTKSDLPSSPHVSALVPPEVQTDRGCRIDSGPRPGSIPSTLAKQRSLSSPSVLLESHTLRPVVFIAMTSAESPGGMAAPPSAGRVAIALDWTPNTNHVGFYAARAFGWYQAAGLDVRVRRVGR